MSATIFNPLHVQQHDSHYDLLVFQSYKWKHTPCLTFNLGMDYYVDGDLSFFMTGYSHSNALF